MVAPITGPFTRTETALGLPIVTGFRPEHLWWKRTWYRQRRPYNLPLTFTYQWRKVLTWTGPGAYYTYRHVSTSVPFPTMSTSTWFPDAYNRAYEKFKAECQPDSAGLAINLAQRKQAIDMIANRSMQILGFANSLRRGNLPAALKSLGLLKDQKATKIVRKYGRKYIFHNGTWKLRKGFHRSKVGGKLQSNLPTSRSSSDLFLELHFGWEPLVGDIHSSIDVLQAGVPPERVSTSSTRKYTTKWNTSTASDPINYYEETHRGTWRISADINVSNPNLWLANQLGLVNPAAVIWDAIPFSFVLGWFVNVDSFLASFTDFWGLSLTNQSITSHWIMTGHAYQIQKNWPKAGANTVYFDTTYKGVMTKRTPGSIPGPTLKIKEPWTLSPTRAATAVSLLVQQLGKFH